jgi:type II restriction enzyme
LGGNFLKQLNFYKDRGLLSPEEIFDYFLATLRESIFTWDYFVDFNKVHKNIKKYNKELSALNDLLGNTEEAITDNFISIAKTNPSIRNVLPLLIAVRKAKLKEMPIICDMRTLSAYNQVDLFNSKIPINDNMEYALRLFFIQTGLKDFFLKSEVKNLIDYCKGVEAGMDTNARKNRTGTLMENIVGKYIKQFTQKYGGQYIEQATKKRISYEWGIELELDKINRRIDFAVLNRSRKLYLFETNYYSGGGSKLKATAGEYKDLEDLLKGQGQTFIWVTDGKGWLTAKTAINETFLHNDYIINLEMITDGILHEIIDK